MVRDIIYERLLNGSIRILHARSPLDGILVLIKCMNPMLMFFVTLLAIYSFAERIILCSLTFSQLKWMDGVSRRFLIKPVTRKEGDEDKWYYVMLKDAKTETASLSYASKHCTFPMHLV